MHLLTVLPHLANSAISLNDLQKGFLNAHQAFKALVFDGFVYQVTAVVRDEKEAPKLVGHLLIKFWIAAPRFQSISEMYNFLDRTIWKDCQGFVHYTCPVDAPIQLRYQEILHPDTRAGLSDEQLRRVIEHKEEEELKLARTVFNLRYIRNYTHEKIQQEMGMCLQEVLQYERMAMQLLYLVLNKSIAR